MFFKLEKGCDLFDKLTKIHSRMVTAHQAAHDIIVELGAESWTKSPCTLAGGISGVVFDNPPPNWKKVWGGKAYYPYKNRSAVADIRKRFQDLPLVKNEDLNDILNFTSGVYGKYFLDRPGPVVWGEDVILYAISDKYVDQVGYEAPENVIEITKTEFDKLHAEILDKVKKE